MKEVPRKDWSFVEKIHKESEEKRRAEMSPEVVAEADKDAKRAEELLGRSREAEKEEAKNPGKIAQEKDKIEQVFKAAQHEVAQKKTSADLIAEARTQNEQLHTEDLAKEKARIERLKEMTIEEKLRFTEDERKRGYKKIG